MRIDVYETPQELAAAAAARLAGLLAETPVTFGLAGGSTPAATYRVLRDEPLQWEHVTCWLPDEGWVPPEDPLSKEPLTSHGSWMPKQRHSFLKALRPLLPR